MTLEERKIFRERAANEEVNRRMVELHEREKEGRGC